MKLGCFVRFCTRGKFEKEKVKWDKLLGCIMCKFYFMRHNCSAAICETMPKLLETAEDCGEAS